MSKQRCSKCRKYTGHNSRSCDRITARTSTKLPNNNFVPLVVNVPTVQQAPHQRKLVPPTPTVFPDDDFFEAENGITPEHYSVDIFAESEPHNSQLGQWSRKTAKQWNGGKPTPVPDSQ